ncbi:hypothetical protein [Paracoccus kondratievae]|uniref:Uncharacterized protein n=1 Tax=Paracoccus kondratievae TaxID=135740 RepID=A0AAD3NY56_9RHOB|nr:hypothetical protein [Paracoccus kondratievae]AZV00233.1 hypothetical protein pkon1_p04 [Paracoccus phage vB_PkoS_Pkon1]GLK63515.1 hypothetical protein GCM10017635_09850 [Paracoccus kondratievae]
MTYAHGFKAGDLVENGSARARVIALVADDALEVIYDGDDEPTVELALYFRRIEQDEGGRG